MKKIIFHLVAMLGFSQATIAQPKAKALPKDAPIAIRKDSLFSPKPVQTGYYSLSSKYISGAIASVPGEAVENQLATNFQTALQGKIAGLQVIQANGQPGADVVLRLRGISSIFGETQPLIVVDGIPVYSGPREKEMKGVGAGWGSVFNPLSDLDPADIESIEVLKDAAASAIYGSRAANGVILVNTKRSERGQTVIDVNHYVGFSNATNRVNSLSGPQYLEQLDRAWTNDGRTGQGQFPAFPVFSRAEAAAVNTNNLDQILEKGFVEELNISTRYGSNQTSFYASGTYHKEKGIISGNDFRRYTGRMGITNQIGKRLSIGLKAALNYIDYNSMPVGYGVGGGFAAAQRNLPVYPLRNTNGSYFFPLNPAVFNTPGSNVEAFQSKNEFDNKERTRRIMIAANLNYNITNGLDLSVDAAMEKYFHNQSNYLSKRMRMASLASGPALAGTPAAYNGYEKYSNDLYNIRTALTYKMSRGSHRFTGVGGFEFIRNENPYFFAEGEGYSSESSRQPAAGNYKNNLTAEALIANTATFAGYFANGNYVYKEKYMLGATVRVDGSSRFGANNKYAVFPAASVGWILSQENFLKNIKAINTLKLRISYGETGNAGIGNYTSLERWETNSNSRYLQQAGIHLAALGTAALKPERIQQLDLGIDFVLAGRRISGSVDYYNKTTKDLLLSFDAPLSAGVSSPGLLLNTGSLRNSGVELSIASKNMVGAFKWSTEFSIAHNKNKVLNLEGLTASQINSHKNIATYEGQPLGVFYLAEYAGVDPATGQELIYDLSGNKVIATTAAQVDAARKPQFDKPSAPKFFGGLNNTFSYKRFDLGIFFTFSYGNYVLDEGERELSYLTGTNNLRETAANSWTPGNTSSDFPRLKYGDILSTVNTTRFLHDASYARLKNLTLGYSLNNHIRKINFLRGARLFLSAQNLVTITKFPGWDPEVAGNYRLNVNRSLNQGITYMDVPQVRTFAFGINLNL